MKISWISQNILSLAIGEMMEHDVNVESIIKIRNIDPVVANNACVVVQSAYRGYKVRKDLREQKRQLLNYIASLGVPYEKVLKATIKIQAAFRGYKTRKDLKDGTYFLKRKETQKIIKNLKKRFQKSRISWKVVELATLRIQKVFRGYRVRKMYKKKIVESIIDEILNSMSFRDALSSASSAFEEINFASISEFTDKSPENVKVKTLASGDTHKAEAEERKDATLKRLEARFDENEESLAKDTRELEDDIQNQKQKSVQFSEGPKLLESTADSVPEEFDSSAEGPLSARSEESDFDSSAKDTEMDSSDYD